MLKALVFISGILLLLSIGYVIQDWDKEEPVVLDNGENDFNQPELQCLETISYCPAPPYTQTNYQFKNVVEYKW